MASDDERTLALAGVYQASVLTQDLARTGRCDDVVLAASIDSLFTFDASTTIGVFGNVGALTCGLRAVVNRMATQAEITDFELSRYVMSLTQLAARLQRDGATAQRLYDGISSLPEAVRRPSGTADSNTSSDSASDLGGRETVDIELCQGLADVYSTTISKMSPQVIVHGEHGHLSDTEIVAKVRAVLLAGVRSAWLWHQLGGRKWHLILQKNRYIASAASQLAVNGINSGP